MNFQNYLVPKDFCVVLSIALGHNIHSSFLEMRIQFLGMSEEGGNST
jgi:hypothetical protein